MTNLETNLSEKIFEKNSQEELNNLEKGILCYITKIQENLNEIIGNTKEREVIITDFDDTIFSLRDFREMDLLKGKRGKEGNNFIINNLGIDKFISIVYEGIKFPDIITKKLRQNLDLILTAGVKEIQESKIRKTGLDKINYVITEKAEDKIIALIKYVVFDLKFIPNKIIIYEDRPEYFIYFKDLIEETLQTELEINYVEMDGNDDEPRIEVI